jgi:uncharacterized protein
MRFDHLPRSDRVDDRRGAGPRGSMRRAGGLGIGTVLLLSLVGWALGINPLYLIGGAQMLSGLRGSPQEAQPAAGSTGTGRASDQTGQFVSAVLGSTEVQWQEIFSRSGRTYQAPTLVMFSGATQSACGYAQSAMGPFYCPNDRKVYLDTTFFRDLEQRFQACDGSSSCQFSQAYVITHEIGHHVQNLLGILPRVQEIQRGMDQVESNQLQVRVELQADCFAGVWAHYAEAKWQLLEPGDIEAAMQTAAAIGDDRLQRRTQGYAVPDAFTHGSSEQRTRWFLTGLRSGQVASCDTFQTARP